MSGQTMPELRTLVVGGDYAQFHGSPHVPERCWRMVRIFADHLAQPVFARRRVASRDRAFFSTPFPHPEKLHAINSHLRRRPWELALPDVPWNRSRCERLLREVDAVYCRFPSCGWEGLHLYELAVRQDKLVFASLHGDWPEVYGHLAKSARFPRNVIYARGARLTRLAFAHVASTARVLFCVGDAIASRYGTGARATVTFANYLHHESDLFPRADTCLDPPYRIIYVGELSPRKGVTHLIGAAAQLRAGGIPVSLSLVGTGEEKDRILRRATSLGLADHVQLHGYVPFGPSLFELYREADLFVLPSLVGEGVPKVIVEAMSQGLPVVATDVGSAASTLDASGGGLAVPAGNEVALAQALRRIVEKPDLRRRLVRAGLGYARRMTNESQRRLVADALERYTPELVRRDP